MTTATLDKDYDYYGGAASASANGSGSASRAAPNSGHPRVKKGLGAMPMQAVEDRDPVTPPPLRQAAQQHGMDPPGSAEHQQHQPPQVDPEGELDGEEEEQQEQTVEGDEALLDLEQLEELHHEAERMKALGNKHMAAQVRNGTNVTNFVSLSGIAEFLTCSFAPFFLIKNTGIHACIQCLFGGSSTISCWPILACFLVESVGCLAVPETILSGCHRCSSCHCIGTHLW